MEIEIWHLVVGIVGQLATFLVATGGLIVKVRNADQAREDKRREEASKNLREMREAIEAGDKAARQRAHEQIEAVRNEVADVRSRVDKVEREVAGMPTRDQLDRGFSDLREAIQHLTQRVDQLHDVPRH